MINSSIEQLFFKRLVASCFFFKQLVASCSVRDRFFKRLVASCSFSKPLAAACLALSLLAACKDEPPPPKPTPSVASDPRPDVLAPGDICVGDGRWKPCTLLDRTERAGLVVKPVDTDTTRVPYLSPAGLHYKVGKSGLLIAFYYQDSLLAKAEWAKLDTLRLVPPGDTVTRWPAKPSPIRAANFIGAYFFANPTQIERVHLIFQGGLPAPQ